MDELYRLFLQISGQPDPALVPVRYALADVLAQLDPGQSPAPQTTVSSKATQSQSGDSESVFSKVLKNAFGVAPLIGGLIDLFSGSDEPPPLTKYALPPSIQFQAAETRDGLTTADFGQNGSARAYPSRGIGDGGSGMVATAPPMPDKALPSQMMQTPQITVNVQAMDARSFLDRSGDIAMAVRDAMLNLNSINDVVNDL
jgi:hypothetical protein